MGTSRPKHPAALERGEIALGPAFGRQRWLRWLAPLHLLPEIVLAGGELGFQLPFIGAGVIERGPQSRHWIRHSSSSPCSGCFHHGQGEGGSDRHDGPQQPRGDQQQQYQHQPEQQGRPPSAKVRDRRHRGNLHPGGRGRRFGPSNSPDREGKPSMTRDEVATMPCGGFADARAIHSRYASQS
jgi:hypothetical protein